jgi:hypothetical protein
MKWFAVFILYGNPFCNKRFAVQANAPVISAYDKVDENCLIINMWNGPYWQPVVGTRTVLRAETCQHVTEYFARTDSTYYTKEYDDCGYDYLMQGPCK